MADFTSINNSSGNTGSGGRQGKGGARHSGKRDSGRHGGRDGRGRGRGGGGRGSGRGRFQGDIHQDYNIANDPVEVIGKPSANSVAIAVVSCCHGEMDAIYERLKIHKKRMGQKIDLLLCCGDFQSYRNPSDFHSSYNPPKF